MRLPGNCRRAGNLLIKRYPVRWPTRLTKMKIITGIEGTYAPQSGKDTLAITGHYQNNQWKNDTALVKQLDVQQFRYPIPWHRIEQQRGTYSWELLDKVIEFTYRELNLSIIADPLHHTSYPAWMKEGFANPDFPSAYARFVRAFAERYPMVTAFTPFNEPTCTLDFSGYRGFWYPYATGDRSYVTMLRHTARATAEAIHAVRQVNPRAYILHVDTFEHHAALDDES